MNEGLGQRQMQMQGRGLSGRCNHTDIILREGRGTRLKLFFQSAETQTISTSNREWRIIFTIF